MSILSYKLADCKNCYKCLRECPVKAISMLNQQAIIIDEYCILCGKCTNVCPQGAKFVKNSVEAVKKLIRENDVYVSLAPSYISSFDVKGIHSINNALKQLGFKGVFETADGAKLVDMEYKKILDINKFPIFITSCCPTVNNLIEKHYPNALNYLAPVDTPMMVHGKMIKNDFPNSKVVFIGPCVAKKQEAIDTKIIDEVLTFNELKEWFDDEGICLNEGLDSKETDESYNSARYYPIERGIIKSIGEYDPNYDYLSVSGFSKCIDVLTHVDELKGLFIEMNACEYGCINGPCINKIPGGSIKSTEIVRKHTRYSLGKEMNIREFNLSIERSFKNKAITLKIPDAIEMKAILSTFGKYKVEDELNCGACGYQTCREKAIAVYNKMAEKEMCLPFMKEQAESLSNEVIKHSPNGIVTIDNNNVVLECNDRAKEILGVTIDNPRRRLVGDIAEMRVIAECMVNKDTINKRYHISKTNKDVMISSVYVQKRNLFFSIIMDITEDEANRKKIQELKQNTIDITNKVIEKQMRSVQEIASLLGETTAETKIAIYNLRKVILDESKED